MTDLEQIDKLSEAVEAKLNKRPVCSECWDLPSLVDHCKHCGGNGLEPSPPIGP